MAEAFTLNSLPFAYTHPTCPGFFVSQLARACRVMIMRRFAVVPLLSLLLAPAFAAEAAKPVAPPAKPAVSLDDIRTFTSVFNLVKQAYVEPVDDKTLMQQAIRGMLAGLDPHSEYLDQHAMEQLTEDTSGS